MLENNFIYPAFFLQSISSLNYFYLKFSENFMLLSFIEIQTWQLSPLFLGAFVKRHIFKTFSAYFIGDSLRKAILFKLSGG